MAAISVNKLIAAVKNLNLEKVRHEKNYFHSVFSRRSIFFKQAGVVSIEYALIAVLIAVAILGTLQATGSANGGIWSGWTGKFIAAVNSAIGR